MTKLEELKAARYAAAVAWAAVDDPYYDDYVAASKAFDKELAIQGRMEELKTYWQKKARVANEYVYSTNKYTCDAVHAAAKTAAIAATYAALTACSEPVRHGDYDYYNRAAKEAYDAYDAYLEELEKQND